MTEQDLSISIDKGCAFSRSLRENEPKEGRYPQGPLHRGMQHEKLQIPTTFLRFGKPGHGLS